MNIKPYKYFLIMKKLSFILMLAALFVTSCSSDKNDEPNPGITGLRTYEQIYKATGDYSNNVSTFTDDTGTIIYFKPGLDNTDTPSPKLSQGFYLGGGGKNTIFLKWTLDEYRALPSIPTSEEMLAKKIPGARVTLCYELPIETGKYEGEELYRRCNELIEAGLPGCKLIYKLEE